MNRDKNIVVFKSASNIQTNQKIKYFGLIFQQHDDQQKSQMLHKAIFYQGQLIQDDIKQGKGYAIFDNGDTYQGEWKNNCIQGFGKFVSNQNSVIYEGEFKDWKKQGKGKITCNNSSLIDQKFTFKGDFKNDHAHGNGRIQFEDLSTYEGQLKNGVQQGFGIYQKKDMKYQGTWNRGLMCGSGKCEWFSQKGQVVYRYTGQYQKGKKHGFGQYYTQNGKLLRGQWVNGKFNPSANSYIVQ